MEKKNNVMAGLLAAGLCLGLLWGVSPSMADSLQQQIIKQRQLKQQPRPQQRYIPVKKLGVHNSKPELETKIFNKSLKKGNSFISDASKVTTKNPLKRMPGYDTKRLNDNMNKAYHSNAGTGPAKINIGQPNVNPKLSPSAGTHQNLQSDIGLKSPPFGHSGVDYQKKLKQAAEAAAAQKKATAQPGSVGWGAGYGKAPSDPNFGGYGGNNGNGVVPPGPDRVPGSTPPPQAQSNQPPITTGGGLFPLPNLPSGSTTPPSAQSNSSGNPSGDPLLNCLASGGALGCFR